MGGDPLYWGASIKLMHKIAYLAQAQDCILGTSTRLHTWHMLIRNSIMHQVAQANKTKWAFVG
jgi:hypothetical protein